MRIHRHVLAAALVLGMILGRALLPPAPRAHAQPSTLAPQAAEPQAGASAPAAPAYEAAPAQGVAPASTSSGLPARAQAPRTLRAYWHVFVAFAIAWALLFGYVVALGRRFSRVERSLETVRGAV